YRIRILEVGAGTGSTTEVVLKGLRPWLSTIEEYCYSDLSRAFLLRGQEQLAQQAPCIRFRMLDVERSLCEQGVAAGTYDIIVAANVLHATRQVRATLRNLKAVLKQS